MQIKYAIISKTIGQMIIFISSRVPTHNKHQESKNIESIRTELKTGDDSSALQNN